VKKNAQGARARFVKKKKREGKQKKKGKNEGGKRGGTMVSVIAKLGVGVKNTEKRKCRDAKLMKTGRITNGGSGWE